MKLGLFAAALLAALSSGSAVAADGKRPKAVVELFTSQGCNSCPPADVMLGQLAAKDDVIALAYHVDYWDYLGWKDTLASPDNTARQQEYARALGNRSVYTPQAIVNGQVHMNGAKHAKVDAAVERMAGTRSGLTVDVDVAYKGGSVIITTGKASMPVTDAHVVLVYFHPATKVEIARGENKGRQFTFRNAVAGFHTAGMWHGAPTRYELPMSEIAKRGVGGCAVLIQERTAGGLPGAILGAAVIQTAAGL